MRLSEHVITGISGPSLPRISLFYTAVTIGLLTNSYFAQVIGGFFYAMWRESVDADGAEVWEYGEWVEKRGDLGYGEQEVWEYIRQKVHRIDDYECRACKMMFPTSRVLLFHRQTSHAVTGVRAYMDALQKYFSVPDQIDNSFL